MVKYGYHGFEAILCLLEEEKEQEEQIMLFRTYVCQAMWDIDLVLRKRFFDLSNDMPQYIELIRPERKRKKLTAAEIKQRTLELFSR